MDSLSATDFTGMAVMIGKGYLVAAGLFVAVIAWRWVRTIEVKHAPRVEDTDAE